MILLASGVLPAETDPTVVGLTAERFDQIYQLIQGLGTVFAVGTGIVICMLAWIALGHER